MNPSLLFHFFFIFFTSKASSFPKQTISYSDHCNSYAPEAIPTDRIFTRFPFLETVTSYYTGGQNILEQDPLSKWSIYFEPTRNLFNTSVADVFKIQARLGFYPPDIYYSPSNNSQGGWISRRPLEFNLDGFWSVSTSKLCMVGSTHKYVKEGIPTKLDVVLKLKFARYITLNNSLVSGILESLATPNDFAYFDPISILGFRRVDSSNYNYTLKSSEEYNVLKTKSLQDSVSSKRYINMCSIFTQMFSTYKMVYPIDCKNCSLIGEDHNGYLPTFVSLYAIQCSRGQKLRFLVNFQDRRSTSYDQSFHPGKSFIGEGIRNRTKNELCIVACRVLNQSDPLDSAHVGDCSVRLTLWFPSTWSITNTHTIEGQIWNTKLKDDTGSFRMAKFQSFDHSRSNYGSKYVFTQMKKVKQICPKKKRAKGRYKSEYVSFDITVNHKNISSFGSAVPIFTGSQGFSDYTNSNPVNIRFDIYFTLNISSTLTSGISSLNLSVYYTDVEISAEGVYDYESGEICMVGCRDLIKNNSFDCEILVKFQLPLGKETLMTGNIESLRENSDALYFEKLDVFALAISETEAIEVIWRLDLEIIMVLFSGTLMCVFTGLQLLHLKKRSEIVKFISVLMMLILTLGQMVPLVLHFDAIFSNRKNVPIGRNGLLEINGVIVRILTMVAFILQFRLLQLTWIAKRNHWIHEIRTIVICLPTYIIGGLAMLLVNWKDNNDIISSQSQRSIWGDMRSYAGLTLDGFLFPQLILNIFQISKGNALSYSFIIGTTFVRLLPHAYEISMGHAYFSHQFDKLYIYANSKAYFFSRALETAIVCGGLVFALIVFLQQRFGGRFMFPKRFQEHVEYETIHVTSNEI